MRIVEHSFSADLDWVENYAAQVDGKVEENFIVPSEKISTGVRYFLDWGDDTVVFYINAVHNADMKYFQKSTKDDFVGFYYDLTTHKAKIEGDIFAYDRGDFGYNLSIIDGILETSYEVKAGSETIALLIFIKKSKIKRFAENNPDFVGDIDKMVDSEQNTFIKFDRISPKSYAILQDLIKVPVTGSVFDLTLISAAHLLISDYLIQMRNNTIVIGKVNQIDFLNIIAVQSYLMENIYSSFPSIKFIAEKAHMSESKFKKLFTKITGMTPNNFFMNHKLIKAKELLTEKKHSISEVSDTLNFGDYSYFISRFKKHFGVSPLDFIKRV
jgi:AraC-like DNA-binding protein